MTEAELRADLEKLQAVVSAGFPLSLESSKRALGHIHDLLAKNHHISDLAQQPVPVAQTRTIVVDDPNLRRSMEVWRFTAVCALLCEPLLVGFLWIGHHQAAEQAAQLHALQNTAAFRAQYVDARHPGQVLMYPYPGGEQYFMCGPHADDKCVNLQVIKK